MFRKVLINQFEIKDGAIIHTPTGAEFTPVSGTPNSPNLDGRNWNW